MLWGVISPVKNLVSTIATIWRLSLPYFRSEDRWPARILLAAVVTLELSLVAIQVILNQWYNRFYNTLEDRDWNAFVSAISVIFPYIVVSPAYFSGAVQLGGLMQTASAFNSVQGALSYFITSYRSIAEWRAVVQRLTGFQDALAAGRAAALTPPAVEVVPREGEAALVIDHLNVRLPAGRPIVAADNLAVASNQGVSFDDHTVRSFRATAGLQQRFGVERVFDTPLSETLISGLCVGMAAQGLRPVGEIQFMGFLYPCIDQLANHASRLRNRTQGRLSCPMVLRTPHGAGIRAPEHHSEATEAMLAHIGPLGRCASTGSGQRPSGSGSAQRRIELCRMSAYLKA